MQPDTISVCLTVVCMCCVDCTFLSNLSCKNFVETSVLVDVPILVLLLLFMSALSLITLSRTHCLVIK